MKKWKFSPILFPGLLALGLGVVALFQATAYSANLAGYALFRGRIVLSSGDFVFPDDDPRVNGGASAVLDGDPERAAILRFPADHPHGTFLLIDTALSHSPGDKSTTQPAARKPIALRIYNGVCLGCDRESFEKYGRIKRARIEILNRRANNPDEEFVIPDARPVFERFVDFPDAPGPIEISLGDLPDPPPSAGWPDQMQYIITHIQVLDVYPGARFPDRFGLAEVVYIDRERAGAPPFAYQRLAPE
ncbi:MAG: hypothetical protein NXI24_12700 [bacterium]|nr:hypothetical protein [bacterium]